GRAGPGDADQEQRRTDASEEHEDPPRHGEREAEEVEGNREQGQDRRVLGGAALPGRVPLVGGVLERLIPERARGRAREGVPRELRVPARPVAAVRGERRQRLRLRGEALEALLHERQQGLLARAREHRLLERVAGLAALLLRA